MHEPVAGHFRPRLTLQTLARGDGLLGMRAAPGFGPRGGAVTVAQIDWTYVTPAGLNWSTPAAARLLSLRAAPPELLRGAWDQRELLQRDAAAERDARDALWASGLRPLPPEALQWRHRDAAQGHDDLWTLPEEQHFSDFWAVQVPKLQADGWSIIVRAGFAHHSVAVDAWRLVIEPGTLQEQGLELIGPLGPHVQALAALRQPPREGSFMTSSHSAGAVRNRSKAAGRSVRRLAARPWSRKSRIISSP